MAPEMAATWNTELMREMGEAMGQEALLGGRQGRMAPAMNLHRSPFQGRVFEYYSEDPVLSGKVAAASVSLEFPGRSPVMRPRPSAAAS